MAEEAELDLLTVAAVGVVAYCAATLLHEAVGHGGACLLVGGAPRGLTAVSFDCDQSAISSAASRAVSAGGSVANLIVAAVCLALARVARRGRYFLFLFTTLNLLNPCGYWLFSGVGGVGDWAAVFDGFQPAWAYRAAFAVTGAALYFFVAPRLARPLLEPFLGADPASRRRRAVRLTLVPYLVGGATHAAAGVLNPGGVRLLLVSAVAGSFGGTSLLAWWGQTLGKPRPGAHDAPLGVRRSVPWLVAAACCLVVFVGILGRGIGSP